MSEIQELLGRIDAEFTAADRRLHDFQRQKIEEHRGRQQRLEQVSQLLEEMKSLWRERLSALAARFGDRMQVEPVIEPGRRECALKVQSKLAHIELRFAISTDNEVRNVVFTYDLRILPILMKFDSHAELSFPIDAIDRGQLTRWLDDRIVSFVQTYLSLHENQFYLQEILVEDPVAKVRFPKFAAGAMLEQNGQTYYFIGEETKAAFLARQTVEVGR